MIRVRRDLPEFLVTLQLLGRQCAAFGSHPKMPNLILTPELSPGASGRVITLARLENVGAVR